MVAVFRISTVCCWARLFFLKVSLNDSNHLASCRKVNAVYGGRFPMVPCVGRPQICFLLGVRAQEGWGLPFGDRFWSDMSPGLFADGRALGCCDLAVLGLLFASGWRLLRLDAGLRRDGSGDLVAQFLWVFAFVLGGEFPS